MNKPATFTAIDTSFRARFTAAEFLHMAEIGAFDDMKVELVDGEIERMNPPQGRHAGLQARVVIRLAQVVSERLILGDVGVAVDNDTVLGCDAALLTEAIDEHRVLRPDEILLVVEIAETTVARDKGMKRIKYAMAGIAHYWVVDGKRSVIHVFGEPIDDDYAQVDTVAFGEPLAVPGTNSTIVVA